MKVLLLYNNVLKDKSIRIDDKDIPFDTLVSVALIMDWVEFWKLTSKMSLLSINDIEPCKFPTNSSRQVQFKL